MSNYTIFTDSGCDIKPELLNAWGVKYENLTFQFVSDGKELTGEDIESVTFYNRMREGDVAKTSAVNIETFKALFKPEFEKGNDILYIGFSSGLSTTYNSGRIALEELCEEFSERKAIAVDTLAASAGQGLLLKLAVDKKKEGASLEELAKFVEDTRLHICHWFTVDDLVYLKRGGRVSPTVAFVGGLLGIKPVMHMDNEGHLINMSKVRGRKSAIEALAAKFNELAIDNTSGPVFISHGDCMEDAKTLASIIKSKHNVDVEIITDVGAVIGSHSGPGTLALFFVGKER